MFHVTTKIFLVASYLKEQKLLELQTYCFFYFFNNLTDWKTSFAKEEGVPDVKL